MYSEDLIVNINILKLAGLYSKRKLINSPYYNSISDITVALEKLDWWKNIIVVQGNQLLMQLKQLIGEDDYLYFYIKPK